MGGENSEVTSETKNILLESAHFNPSHIRKVSKALSLSTDASYRFERNVDPNFTGYAANRAAELIAEVSGGVILKGLIDVYPKKIKEKEVLLRFSRIKKVLGYEISKGTVIKILEKLGLRVLMQTADKLRLQVPTYRPDLEREIDLIEEVARIYGYDKIPAVPKITITLEKKYDESEKFYSEWNVLKQLPIQENIIGFIGVVKWDSHMGLVFEYVDHGDLTEYLEKNCMDMELRTCICILCGIAEGINALQNHDPCIIHKDLSSRNILLTKSHLVPKICDFGSAICVYKSSPPVGRNRSHSTSDMNYYAWSTDEYVAPEIWDDSASCSFKSDIYSFGILAMEIAIAITEKKYYLPFRYGTSFQNQFEKIENIRTGISPILPYNVNPVFLPFIRNCINKKPENRPTAQQLVHDLRENINLI